MMRLRLTMLAAWLFLAATVGAAVAGPSDDEASAYSAYKRADYATALRLFRPLADQDNAYACYNLGVMYRDGKGVPQNYAEALRLFRLAADQGWANARFNIGVMYGSGQGVPQNYVEAGRWYRLAADQGFAQAEYNLGVEYSLGQGVPRNYAEALRLFRRAADKKVAQAQYNLGVSYETGLGTPQNDPEAQKWYRLAADQGFAQAQHDVGVIYRDGKGVPQNYVLAHMWLSLSAANGYKDAPRERDAVAQHISSAQIAEAQKLAHDWRPTTTVAQGGQPQRLSDRDAGLDDGAGPWRDYAKPTGSDGFDPDQYLSSFDPDKYLGTPQAADEIKQRQKPRSNAGAGKPAPNFFDRFDAPAKNSTAGLPAWDNLPVSDGAPRYEGMDWDQAVQLSNQQGLNRAAPNAASTKAQWRFTALTLRLAEWYFLIGVALVIPIWLILRLPNAPQAEVAAEIGQRRPYL